MDPGEQTTGTRDEHYDLVSVLYHAMHAAETMEAYILDAEATGDERLASYFREAQAMQRRLAERAKGMLGILEVPPEPGVAPALPPGGGVSPGDVSGGIPPEGAVSPEGRAGPPEGVEGSSTGAVPPGEIPPERSTGVVSDVTAEVTTGRIGSEDFDPTTSALRGGVENLVIGRALSEIDGWEQKLEESGDPQLAPIAENLRQFRALLTADRLVAAPSACCWPCWASRLMAWPRAASGRASAASCGNWAGCSPPRDAPSLIGVDRRAWEGVTPGEVRRLARSDNVCGVSSPKTESKRVKANEIHAVLDSTVACLQGGVQRLGIEAALPVIEGWEGRLAASAEPELVPVADNPGALRYQLLAGDFDQATVGRLLADLGDQVQRLANSDIQIEIADQLSQLSVLLSSEDDFLSGE